MKTTTEKLSRSEFELGLKQFTGPSEQYWDHQYYKGPNLQLSDGCNYIKAEGDASWLFDWLSYCQNDPEVIFCPYQTWTMRKLSDVILGTYFFLSCKRADGKQIFHIRLFDKEFPMDRLEFRCCDRFVFLPSEDLTKFQLD
jgi:hypothetical protein